MSTLSSSGISPHGSLKHLSKSEAAKILGEKMEGHFLKQILRSYLEHQQEMREDDEDEESKFQKETYEEWQYDHFAELIAQQGSLGMAKLFEAQMHDHPLP